MDEIEMTLKFNNKIISNLKIVNF